MQDLAEKADLSINYVSLLERGESTPALDIFIDIVKALSVTSDIILIDVLNTGYHPQNTQLSGRITTQSPEDHRDIFLL
jgi:transcriptional regulator with XRE-family HTH domain